MRVPVMHGLRMGLVLALIGLPAIRPAWAQSSSGFVLRKLHADGDRLPGGSSARYRLKSVYIGAGAQYHPSSSANYRLRILSGTRVTPVQPPDGCQYIPNFCMAPAEPEGEARSLGFGNFVRGVPGLESLRLRRPYLPWLDGAWTGGPAESSFREG